MKLFLKLVREAILLVLKRNGETLGTYGDIGLNSKKPVKWSSLPQQGEGTLPN